MFGFHFLQPPKPPPAKPSSPPKQADKMPIPLPKSLTEANTNGQNGNGAPGNVDERVFGIQKDEKVLPTAKDATNDFIKGETNAFIQSIKEAQQLGER